ncbi:hypothetical protein SADUNF_Sadunf19G0060600 [Salix dunnii]|uniref:Uncharacterized protein n=1 Tax=Salix dunnii TaxID=1413687 RepID=A0A835J209_9ROSI|nr:hypothetical protein SADUNF_Sadunf19G0060600 [Salix dunnii]
MLSLSSALCDLNSGDRGLESRCCFCPCLAESDGLFLSGSFGSAEVSCSSPFVEERAPICAEEAEVACGRGYLAFLGLPLSVSGVCQGLLGVDWFCLACYVFLELTFGKLEWQKGSSLAVDCVSWLSGPAAVRRINQVAFLGDNTTRRSPSLKIPAARPRRARKSILSSTSSSKSGRKAEAPQLHVLHPSRERSHVVDSTRVRSRRTQAAIEFAPGETRQRGHLHLNSTEVGRNTGTRPKPQ